MKYSKFLIGLSVITLSAYVVFTSSCKKEEESVSNLLQSVQNRLIKSNGEGSFIREITYGNYISLWSIAQLDNDEFIISGETQCNSFAAKLNNEGATKWNSSLKMSGSTCSRAWNIEPLSDNEYVIAAFSASSRNNVASYSPWLYALDENGSFKWEFIEYSAYSGVLTYSDLLYFNDAYILCAGKRGLGSISGGFVQKLIGNEPQGELIDFGKDSVNSIHTIHPTVDNGLIACGTFNNYSFIDQMACLIKLDSALNKEWGRSYSFTASNGPLSAQEVTGGYILSGQTIETIKVDHNGDVIWRKNMSSNYIDVTKDGQIIAAFENKLRKINAITGDIIWERVFANIPNVSFAEVHETNDLGFILVGNVREGRAQKGVIIKTDKDGY